MSFARPSGAACLSKTRAAREGSFIDDDDDDDDEYTDNQAGTMAMHTGIAAAGQLSVFPCTQRVTFPCQRSFLLFTLLKLARALYAFPRLRIRSSSYVCRKV